LRNLTHIVLSGTVSVATLAMTLVGCSNPSGQVSTGAPITVAAQPPSVGAATSVAVLSSCVSDVKVWLHSRRGKIFTTAFNDSSTMWAAVKSDDETKVIAEAQGFNTAAIKALHISLPHCAKNGAWLLDAVFAWIGASVDAIGGDLSSTSSELSQANGYLSKIGDLKQLMPQVAAHAIVIPIVSCKDQHWPQPVPHGIIGREIDSFGDANLWCFNVVAAYAPGSTHNVLNDPANTMHEWVITGISPPPGTIVNASTPLTLSVKSA
jgi:hypothetical protein